MILIYFLILKKIHFKFLYQLSDLVFRIDRASLSTDTLIMLCD